MKKIGICGAEPGEICNCLRAPEFDEIMMLENAGIDTEDVEICDPDNDHSHGGITAENCIYREEIE